MGQAGREFGGMEGVIDTVVDELQHAYIFDYITNACRQGQRQQDMAEPGILMADAALKSGDYDNAQGRIEQYEKEVHPDVGAGLMESVDGGWSSAAGVGSRAIQRILLPGPDDGAVGGAGAAQLEGNDGFGRYFILKIGLIF